MPLPTEIRKKGVREVRSEEMEAGYPEFRGLRGAAIIKQVPYPRISMNPFLNPLLLLHLSLKERGRSGVLCQRIAFLYS
jgi:hypothetical protein